MSTSFSTNASNASGIWLSTAREERYAGYLRGILALKETLGYTPSFQELSTSEGVGPTAIKNRIATLCSLGYIERTGSLRKYHVTDCGKELIKKYAN